MLAFYGTGAAVPALAKLLPDKELSSWARIALEAIPGPPADQALRKAMRKLQGRLLVGTINSIAYRRDPKAVSALAKKLNDSNTDVAAAAALALGRIGSADASKHLQRALAANRDDIRAAVAEGCVLCAENFAAAGKTADAVKLYDTVRMAAV